MIFFNRLTDLDIEAPSRSLKIEIIIIQKSILDNPKAKQKLRPGRGGFIANTKAKQKRRPGLDGFIANTKARQKLMLSRVSLYSDMK